VDVGVAYFAFIDTDMVRGADSHPTLGGLRDAESRRDDPARDCAARPRRAEVRAEPAKRIRGAGGPRCALLRQSVDSRACSAEP